MPAAFRVLFVVSLCLTLSAPGVREPRAVRRSARRGAERQRSTLSAADDALLEDLSKRSFMFFWEQADPDTGIVRDRARTTARLSKAPRGTSGASRRSASA